MQYNLSILPEMRHGVKISLGLQVSGFRFKVPSSMFQVREIQAEQNGRSHTQINKQAGIDLSVRRDIIECMNRGFFLKLTFGILAGFGLLIAGFYVYEPVWFKIQGWRLTSSDPETVKSAAAAVIEKGKPAIPFIRKWLGSESDKHVIGACKIIDKMPVNECMDFLPELETILKRTPSETTKMAAFIVCKNNCVFNYKSGKRIEWLLFKNMPNIKRNILLHILTTYDYRDLRNIAAYEIWDLRLIAVNELYEMKAFNKSMVPTFISVLKKDPSISVRCWMPYLLGIIKDERSVLPLIDSLFNDEDNLVRADSAEALGEIGDNRAVLPLLETIETDWSFALEKAAQSLGKIGDSSVVPRLINEFQKRRNEYDAGSAYIADTLGRIGDSRAVLPLIAALGDNEGCVRSRAALALGMIADNRAIIPLLDALNDIDCNVRYWAVDSLGEFCEIRAVVPIIHLLENDIDCNVRGSAASALGCIGDNRAIAPLFAAASNDNELFVRFNSFFALSVFENANDELMDSLYKKASRELPQMKIALAWRRGGENLASVTNMGWDDVYPEKYFIAYAQARWGNFASLQNIFLNNDLNLQPFDFIPFHKDILSRMPDGFPEYNYYTPVLERKKQALHIREWFDKNKSRLAWDAEKRKYYLK
jgi:HEAT repeat protein